MRFVEGRQWATHVRFCWDKACLLARAHVVPRVTGLHPADIWNAEIGRTFFCYLPSWEPRLNATIKRHTTMGVLEVAARIVFVCFAGSLTAFVSPCMYMSLLAFLDGLD